MICVDVVHGGDADDYVDVGDVVDAVVVQDLQLILLHPGADHHKLLDKPKDVRPGNDHDGCNDHSDHCDEDYDVTVIIMIIEMITSIVMLMLMMMVIRWS